MKAKQVRDLMLALSEYPTVSEDASLLDAVLVLHKSQQALPQGRQPHRAVLIVDGKGEVVGKIGQLAILKALEPKYNSLGDLELLSKSGLDAEIIHSMMEHFSFWQDSLTDMCSRAQSIKVRDVMHPVSVGIEESATLAEAIHRIVMAQTLSLLVRRNKQVVGILRLSDLLDAITDTMKEISAAG